MKQITLDLNVEEVDIALKAISQLPYYQVHELIYKIQQQAQPQLEEMKKVNEIKELSQ